MEPGHGTSTHLQLQPRLRMCAATPPISDTQNDNFNFCPLLLFLSFLFYLEFNDVIGCLIKKDSLAPSHCRAVLKTPTPQHVKLTLLHIHSDIIIIVNKQHGLLLLFGLKLTKINQFVLSVNIFRHPTNEQFNT
jgi:hypothetical protein